MRDKRTLGFILVFTASICWSLNAPLVKGIQLDAFLLTGLRALIAGVALAPFIRVKRIVFNRYLLLMIVSYILQCACIVVALKHTSTSIAVGMQFTAPVWLYFWERKRGTPHRFGRVWPLLVLLTGTVIFMCSSADGVTMKGNLIALSTSLWFAAVTYFSKKCTGGNPLGVTSISNLCCALVVLPLLVPHPVSAIAAIPAAQWPLLLLLGIVQLGMGYGLYYMGMRTTSAMTAAMISPMEMILGPVWVALFLKIAPDPVGILGCVVVMAGVVGEVLMAKKYDVPAPQA